MQRYFFLISAICCLSHHLFSENLSYTITEKNYLFSKEFEMQSKDFYFGTLIKTKFSIHSQYNLYNPQGNYEGQGICRILSLGAICAWAKELDIYDVEGNKIGMIDGQALTSAKAKYSFYDSTDSLVGIAYLDYGSLSFRIVHPSNDHLVLALLKRNFVENTVDNWDITIYATEAIDSRILKIFSAFAVDFQSSFKEDV